MVVLLFATSLETQHLIVQQVVTFSESKAFSLLGSKLASESQDIPSSYFVQRLAALLQTRFLPPPSQVMSIDTIKPLYS
jgi:hypothetical protein